MEHVKTDGLVAAALKMEYTLLRLKETLTKGIKKKCTLYMLE
jgi:hypothetical protein